MNPNSKASITNRPEHVSFRRFVVALVCAAVSALLMSRINRPMPLGVLLETHAADEVLPKIQLDMRSLHAATASIQDVAKARIVFAQDVPLDDREPANWPALPLRNIRLGTVLSIVLEHFRERPKLSYLYSSERSGEIVIDNPPALPVYLRAYDVSDLLARYDEAKPRRTGSEQSLLSATSSRAIEELFLNCSGSSPWIEPKWDAQVWAGFLIVKADPQQQREVQKLLAGLRRHFSRIDSRRKQ